jgi:hypothetical protein
MRRAVIVDPGLIVHANRVDDKRIPFVMADRFSIPGRFDDVRVRHVEIDIPDLVVHLRDEQHFLRTLDDVQRLRRIEQERGNAHRPAADLPGISVAAREVAIIAFLQFITRPGRQNRIVEVGDPPKCALRPAPAAGTGSGDRW